MRAGFFTCDITPPIGMEQPGDYHKAYIERIHDPLKVRAAVLEADGVEIAFVGVDTCGLSSARTIARVRSEIERQCGIPALNIMVAASHAHSAGPLAEIDGDGFADASPLVQRLVTEFTIISDPLYAEWVSRQMVTAVVEAYHRLETALVAIGSGSEGRYLFNRRVRMSNGRTYSHPGKGNPDNVAFAGPVDPEVGVMAAWTPGGDLLGCLVNYSCHCTVFGGSGVSADYVCYLEQTIQRVMSTEAPVVFLNGACGDVTQVDNLSLDVPEFGERHARRVGTRVGAEALKVIATAEPGEHTPIASATKTLCLKYRVPSAQRLEASRRIVDEGIRTGQRDTTWTFAKELLMLEHIVARQPIAEIELQALQIGQTVFVSCPAELFCALGLRIKQGSPFANTYIVELANGLIGYVPTPEAFAPDGGGYETVLTSVSNLEPDAGDRIVEGCLDLARSLTPGIAPAVPQCEPNRHSVDLRHPRTRVGVSGGRSTGTSTPPGASRAARRAAGAVANAGPLVARSEFRA